MLWALSAQQKFVERAHEFVLLGFAAMLALFEGPAEILCIAALLTTLVSGRMAGFRPGLVELGLLIWGLAGLPGLLVAQGKLSSGDTTRPLFALALFVGRYGFAGLSQRALQRIVGAFLGLMVLNGIYGLVQLKWGALPWDSWFLKNPKSAQIYIPGRVYHERASSGLFYNRLKLAHLGVVALLAMGLLIAEKSSWTKRGALVVGALLLLASVVFSYARMSLLALCASGMLLALLLARIKVIAGVVISSLALGGGFLMSAYGQRRVEALAEDLEIRRAMFNAAISIFEQHPILGVGHGVYRSVSAGHMPESLTGVLLTSPHNIWLQTLAETGVVGFLGFNLVLGVGLWRGIRAARRPQDNPRERVADRWSLMVVSALLIVGLMHFTLHHAAVALAFWTAMGVAVRARNA